MRKPYTLQNDIVTGRENVRAGQIEMLRDAIAEIERGTVDEFILIKSIKNDEHQLTVVTQATHPNGFMSSMAHSIGNFLSKG